MSKYGDLNFDDEWYRKPISRYLTQKREIDDVTDGRFRQIKRAIAESPTGAEWESWDEHIAGWEGSMTTDDGRAFLHQLRSAGLAERSVEEKMRIVQSFLKELLDRNVIESNPVAFVCDETQFDPDDKDKLDRSVAEIGRYLREIPDLQMRALGVLFAKTGIRKGENLNIDLPYLHLDHDNYYELLDDHDVTLADEIVDNPDALYIPTEPTIGEEFRGEKRSDGNKRERGTRIPIDAELKKALIDWLAVRPETEFPHPLWTSPIGKPERMAGAYLPKLTDRWAEKTGLVDDGGTGAFTPHWFRHFFTTNMQPGRGHHDPSIPPTVVKYIRGDVGTATEGSGTDIMDKYSHDWGDQVRKRYLNNIYQFGIYD